MKIVFASNFLNHHQLPLCNAFVEQTNGNFYFVATSPINIERLKFGYEDMNKKYPWVIRSYESKEEKERAWKEIFDADVVIMGSAPDGCLAKRLRKRKLTFRYSERLYRKKPKWYEMPARLVKNFFRFGRFTNLYMLSASAYTAYDYSRTFNFIDKCFKWGYFPEVKRYESINEVIDKKDKNSIIWVARFLSLKHPEKAIKLAQRLKAEGYNFTLKMIGNGALLEKAIEVVKEKNLEDCVKILGAMSPEQVRAHMEQSEIHIFTSDRNEGWGAVLNEAMNSGCVPVASKAIGSVPFLMENEKNGLIYEDSDFEDFYNKVKFLLDNPDKRKELGVKAYDTMIKEWNAENAVKKFIFLAEKILADGPINDVYEKGVMSKAELIKG